MPASNAPGASSDEEPGGAPVRICVIDLGTNSFHAVIVDLRPNGSFEQMHRLKEMVHLGDEALEGGKLTEEAMTRAFTALKRICTLARERGVRTFVACATSALREAKNGDAFIERVRCELDLVVRPISGAQEAELIYRGVRRAVGLDTPALIVDIGGGSVECIVANRQKMHFAESLKLGAARMTARFIHTDPLSEAGGEALRTHYHEALRSTFAACREHGVRQLVGSSGTMESLAAVCARRRGDSSDDIFQQTYPAGAFGEAARWVVQASRSEREACTAIEAHRVAQVPAGAVLVEVLLKALPAMEEVRVSPYALREGMVVHFIEAGQSIAHSGGKTP